MFATFGKNLAHIFFGVTDKMDLNYEKIFRGTIIVMLLFWSTSCSFSPTRELVQRREQWSAQKIVNYRYEIVLSAFYPDRGKPVLIEVREGKQVSLKCVKCELQRPETFAKLDTIEKIFDAIETSFRDSKYSVSVNFDDKFGYPTYWRLSGDSSQSDNTSTYKISNFEVLK